jgi:hypothetical protein
MTTHKSMLCVGGPLGGKRYAVRPNLTGFAVPIQISCAGTTPQDVDYRPNVSPPVEISYYHAETFHTPQGDVEFWVPDGQTPLETIMLLLDVYEMHP